LAGRVAVVGVGRIGLRVAWELSREGFDVVLLDSKRSQLERASKVVEGSESLLVDASQPQALARALRGVDYVAVTLPGSLGPVGVEAAIEAGVDAVDVSFYPELPEALAGEALRGGVRLLLDAGVAPGLSNMLVAAALDALGGRAGEACILVGGVSQEPAANPLGLSATWNAEDLIDEYLRPARVIEGGRLSLLDPLSSVCRAHLPRLGVMEAFPTDGLRSLTRTLAGRVSRLAEYTVRYPGHIALIQTLKRLGLFDETPLHVDGCMVKPRAFTARLIERIAGGAEDIVVLAVKAEEDGASKAFFTLVESGGGWSAMARATGGFAAAALTVALHGGLLREAGIHYPEELGFNPEARGGILEFLRRRGINVEEVDPDSVSIEECG
jgi:lysine 6-dehydrogenase